jgi:glycosyltransferase involved in cell wall biosynthesis
VRVSVVVPCYNHRRYVARCLAAIDAQAVDDLEVVVVDDGSTDGSWDVLRQARWQPSRRVQLVRTANAGAHAALNRGLDLATGDWIALCNSDDEFVPGRLPALLAAATREGARFAFSAVRYVDDDGRDVSASSPYAADLVAKQDAIRTFPSVGFALVLSNVTISTGNFFVARSLVDEVGGFRPYRYVHDWDWALRALLVTEPLYVPEVLYRYRLHGTNSFTSLGDAAAVECPELMRRFLRATMTERWPNRLAPSPRNWPVYFEWFLEEHGYQPYCVGWEGIDGPVHRPPRETTPVLERAIVAASSVPPTQAEVDVPRRVRQAASGGG